MFMEGQVLNRMSPFLLEGDFMFNDPITALLQKAVSGAGIRHEAIVNNISNVNTPGYKRIDVDFKSSLSAAVNSSSNIGANKLYQKIEAAQPQILRENHTSMREDGNNVDIEREMSLLAKNDLEYEYYISLLSKKMRMIKNVVNEGRR